MSHHAAPHINEEMHECIHNCSHCHDLCLLAVRHCLEKGGEHASVGHITALLDCAQACATANDFMLRGSEMHGKTCGACAEACERCAEACEAIGDDDLMRKLAEQCRKCAESCRQMASH